jgi:multicomponent Na+:H+ antiporter subunit G
MITYFVVILLALGSGVVLISCLGLWLMPTAYDRLHYVGPTATLGVICFAVAVILAEGFNPSGIKAFLVAAIILVMSPVLTHATARAMRIREFGRWRVLPEEKEEKE